MDILSDVFNSPLLSMPFWAWCIVIVLWIAGMIGIFKLVDLWNKRIEDR